MKRSETTNTIKFSLDLGYKNLAIKLTKKKKIQFQNAILE